MIKPRPPPPEQLTAGKGTYYIRTSENGTNATGTYTVVVTRIE